MKLKDVDIKGWKSVYVFVSSHSYTFKDAKKKFPDLVIRKIEVVDGIIYLQCQEENV